MREWEKTSSPRARPLKWMIQKFSQKGITKRIWIETSFQLESLSVQWHNHWEKALFKISTIETCWAALVCQSNQTLSLNIKFLNQSRHILSRVRTTLSRVDQWERVNSWWKTSFPMHSFLRSARMDLIPTKSNLQFCHRSKNFVNFCDSDRVEIHNPKKCHVQHHSQWVTQSQLNTRKNETQRRESLSSDLKLRKRDTMQR